MTYIKDIHDDQEAGVEVEVAVEVVVEIEDNRMNIEINHHHLLSIYQNQQLNKT